MRVRSPERSSSALAFSWWLLVVPGIGAAASLFFLWIMLFVIPAEQRVLRNGQDANAKIVRVWRESSRDAKGRQRTNHYAQLAWSDDRGTTRQFDRLRIGIDAFRQLEAEQAEAKPTAIRYDASDQVAPPFLLADREYRESDWKMAKWAFGGFGIFTLWGLWLVRRSWQRRQHAALFASGKG